MISINIYEIIMQMVNFLILLYLLNRFLIKPLSEFVESRSAGIKSDIDNAKKNKNDSQALLEEQKQLLNDARQEAKSIREKAEQSSVVERDQILLSAKNESQQMLSQAKKDIDLVVDKAKKDLITDVGTIAVTLAESVLKRTIDHKDKEVLIEDGLKKISQS